MPNIFEREAVDYPHLRVLQDNGLLDSHLANMAAANHRFCLYALEVEHILAGFIALDRLNMSHRHQCIAVNADKAVGKLSPCYHGDIVFSKR